MSTELFDKCYQDLKNYSNLDSKQKRNLVRNLEDLLDENFDEGKKLFLEFFELFDLDSKFENIKEIFKEKSEDYNQLRKEKILPVYLSKLKNLIQKTLSNEEQKIFSKIFSLIIEISPEDAFNLYEENERAFNLDTNLKSIITSNWDILKKFEKPFEIGKDFYPLYKVRNFQFYHKRGFLSNAKKHIHGDIFTPDDEKKSINLLVVGETGTGKTTLLNSMVNYLLGIKYDDSTV